MPIYDYRCPVCKQVKTALSRDEPVRCYCTSSAQIGDMSSVAMTRLPSSPAFVIKGFSAKNGYSDAD